MTSAEYAYMVMMVVLECLCCGIVKNETDQPRPIPPLVPLVSEKVDAPNPEDFEVIDWEKER